MGKPGETGRQKEDRMEANRPWTPSRASFLGRSAAVLLGAAATGTGLRSAGAADDGTTRDVALKLRGKTPSKVRRWDVITIGNLSRNRYWGESDERGVRSAICTCTVVAGADFRLLVDPSLKEAKAMAEELDRRTGLACDEIDTVFITHAHGDHHFGLPHFAGARWLAPREVADSLNGTGRYEKKIEPAPARLFDAVDVISTPGHTMDHHSLRFDCDGFAVVAAGDAVPTRDFWAERRGYYNCVDFPLSARTMDAIAAAADIVIPGHDNFFLNLSSD